MLPFGKYGGYVVFAAAALVIYTSVIKPRLA